MGEKDDRESEIEQGKASKRERKDEGEGDK